MVYYFLYVGALFMLVLNQTTNIELYKGDLRVYPFIVTTITVLIR